MLIEITEKAELDLEKIDEYVLERWSKKILLDFYKKFEKIIDNIANGKVVYQKHENSNYHKAIITKHNTLVYHLSEDKLTIIRVINNFRSEDNKEGRLIF